MVMWDPPPPKSPSLPHPAPEEGGGVLHLLWLNHKTHAQQSVSIHFAQ